MKTTRLLLWMLFLSGALIYVIGFWRACPLLSGKGYFLGVLMTGMFVTYVYQRAVNLNHHMFTGASFVATSAKYGGLTHQPARIDALQQYGQQ